MEEDEGKANSSKMADRLSDTASNGEVEQKLSLRQKHKGKPRLWVIVLMVVSVVLAACPTTDVIRPSIGVVEELICQHFSRQLF